MGLQRKINYEKLKQGYRKAAISREINDKIGSEIKPGMENNVPYM